MATWNKHHDNPISAIEELIERLDRAEADRDKLVETLRWVRANFAGGSTKEISDRIEAAIESSYPLPSGN